ncbi:hypothetical protein GJ699_17930 [Duganella sp. FT80W]|uniref:Uncharacterized protein n=1 Tax=Duganella guangzhouensis TaxID=2666084 RepID=A0A6I2L3Z6_9BURK|nr:hypothetical protein [Duganella guangzhouensis]MRW91877.1 hypothetical protein [Duganella guangzhouensis]
MAFHIPAKMTEGVASRVDLWIALNMPADQLKAKLAEALQMDSDNIKIEVKPGAKDPAAGGEQVRGRDQVYVGQHMTATLSGNEADFIIIPSGPAGKSLINEGMARWDWSVTPKHASGSAALKLVLQASIDRGVDQDAFPSVHESIAVEAAPQTLWQKSIRLIKAATEGVTLINGLLSLLGLASVAGLLGRLKQSFSRRSSAAPTVPPAQQGEEDPAPARMRG